MMVSELSLLECPNDIPTKWANCVHMVCGFVKLLLLYIISMKCLNHRTRL